MKIKTLALTALAASMTFAACDNEDNGGSQPQDLMPKSVTITLPNIQKSTRATGDAADIRQTGGYAVARLSLADPLHLILGARISTWEMEQNYYDY